MASKGCKAYRIPNSPPAQYSRMKYNISLQSTVWDLGILGCRGFRVLWLFDYRGYMVGFLVVGVIWLLAFNNGYMAFQGFMAF